jgi:hypothetical protein
VSSERNYDRLRIASAERERRKRASEWSEGEGGVCINQLEKLGSHERFMPDQRTGVGGERHQVVVARRSDGAEAMLKGMKEVSLQGGVGEGKVGKHFGEGLQQRGARRNSREGEPGGLEAREEPRRPTAPESIGVRGPNSRRRRRSSRQESGDDKRERRENWRGQARQGVVVPLDRGDREDGGVPASSADRRGGALCVEGNGDDAGVAGAPGGRRER